MKQTQGRWWGRGIGIVLVLLSLLVYGQRLPLLHAYLKRTDAVYAARAGVADHGAQLPSALLQYACEGNHERVEFLLRSGVRPQGGNLDRALLCAAGGGHVPTVLYLLEKGVDVDAVVSAPGQAEDQPRTALQMAVERSQQAMAQLLLDKGADPSLRGADAQGQAGLAPLQLAARSGNLHMVRLLVGKRAKVAEQAPAPPIRYYVESLVANSGGQPIDWRARLAEAESAALLLHLNDGNGASLLHWAAGHGQLDLIEALLQRGLRARETDRDGVAPFMMLLAWYASAGGADPGPELEIALRLLSAGIDNFNGRVDVPVEKSRAVTEVLHGFSVGEAAAARPRVRALFGRRIDYAAVGLASGRPWPLTTREAAAQLIADLDGTQLRAARGLPAALRAKGWEELARHAQYKR